jgi:hypothetical protein
LKGRQRTSLPTCTEQNLSDPRRKAFSRVLFSRTLPASNLLNNFDILPRTVVVVIVVIVALLVVLVVVLVTLVCVVVLIIIVLEK